MLRSKEIDLFYALLIHAHDFFETIEDKCIKGGVTEPDRIAHLAECLGVDPDAWQNWRNGE